MLEMLLERGGACDNLVDEAYLSLYLPVSPCDNLVRSATPISPLCLP